MSTRTITLRASKGSALTHAEMDANLQGLDTDLSSAEGKIESLEQALSDMTVSLPDSLGVGSYVLGTLRELGSYPLNSLVPGSTIQASGLQQSTYWGSLTIMPVNIVLAGTWRNMGPGVIAMTEFVWEDDSEIWNDYSLLMRVL